MTWNVDVDICFCYFWKKITLNDKPKPTCVTKSGLTISLESFAEALNPTPNSKQNGRLFADYILRFIFVNEYILYFD